MTFFIQKHIKTFWVTNLLISLAIIMLFPLSTYAAYGSNSYGGCAYGQDCPTSTTASNSNSQNKILGVSPKQVIEISSSLVAIVLGGGTWWIIFLVRKRRRLDDDTETAHIITPT